MRAALKVLLTVVAMCLLSAGPARAGEAEMALLGAYVGSWTGASVLHGGENPEAFSCRLKMSPGRQSKINYVGRCKLVNMNLSVSGTIAFNDKASRYEATMRSNVGFSAGAVGVKKGERISFHLSERQRDRGGNPMEIASVIELHANRITVDFNVEFNRSGQVLTTSVPFQRQ